MTDPIRSPGRPRLPGGKARNIVLDDEAHEIAYIIGNGNVSAGVRKALMAYRDPDMPVDSPAPVE